MELLNKSISKAVDRPVKILQFGEGNFLRGFVDYMIDIANETGDFDGSIVLVKPIVAGSIDTFKAQECQYTLSLRGKQDGREQVITRIITSIKDIVSAYETYEEYAAYAKLPSLRFIVSNTTEAGIIYNPEDKLEDCPPSSYPGKLTKFLYERFQEFNGDYKKGLIILPVELIDNNGIELKKCVIKYVEQWKLGEEFIYWLNKACVFCSTLVDRIITGYPKDEIQTLWEKAGYQDNLWDTGELFALWVIESEKDIKDELPLDRAGLPVLYTDNQKPYKERKVRILNGAHTSFVLASFLAGNNYVGQSMKDNIIRNFMLDTIFHEIIPTLSLPEEELKTFANAVLERFENPFIKHELLSISLNSVSKWRARCMPSLLKYVEQTNSIPPHLAFSVAALMKFYSSKTLKDGCLIGDRDGEEYLIKDDLSVLEFFQEHCTENEEEFTKHVLENISFWGKDLTKIKGLSDIVEQYIVQIRKSGMRHALETIFHA